MGGGKIRDGSLFLKKLKRGGKDGIFNDGITLFLHP